MSFAFDVDTKERVRAATDIVDYIGQRLELRRQGRNYVALCPWHADRKPSLQINAEKQIWKCWVCDIGGDVFNFVMQDEGLAFPEALHKLAERAGIKIETKKSSKFHDQTNQKSSLYEVLKWAGELYRAMLLEPAAKQVRAYLSERGLTEETLEKFQVGLAPKDWSFLLDRCGAAGFNPTLLEAAGLATKKDRGGYYDFFRNRVMFPIRDREHRTIAFGGRVIPGAEEEGGKYINSRETRLFSKSQQLYGFDHACNPVRQSRQAIVMEGYTDVMWAHQCGINNAVAVLGTALGAAHLKMLRHYCDQIVLLLDGDAAGQQRSDDVLELFLHAQLDVRVLTLPNQLDPADYLQQNGAEPLRELVLKSVDALEFKMRRVSTGFDPLLDTHRANAAVEEMIALLGKVPSSGLLTNDSFRVRQDQILSRLSRQFGVPEVSLRERLKNVREKQNRTVRREAPVNPNAQSKLLRPSDLSAFERELLELIIVSPAIATLALERVQAGWLLCDASRQMLAVYEELECNGQSLEFDQVLNTLEDPSLKSLLVTLYEQATVKLNFTKESPESRFRQLTFRKGQQQDELQQQRQVIELQKKQLSEEDKLDLLKDVIRQARLRQGLEDRDQASQPANDVSETGQSSTQ